MVSHFQMILNQCVCMFLLHARICDSSKAKHQQQNAKAATNMLLLATLSTFASSHHKTCPREQFPLFHEVGCTLEPSFFGSLSTILNMFLFSVSRRGIYVLITQSPPEKKKWITMCTTMKHYNTIGKKQKVRWSASVEFPQSFGSLFSSPVDWGRRIFVHLFAFYDES